MVIENIENVVADVRKLLLDLATVVANALDVSLILLALLLLLNRGDDPPRGTASTDDVLVGDGEQVALLDGELDIELSDSLHGRHHLVVALSLHRRQDQPKRFRGQGITVKGKGSGASHARPNRQTSETQRKGTCLLSELGQVDRLLALSHVD